MEINDLLKNPQLFAVKKDGFLQTKGGLCNDKFSLMAFWLSGKYNVAGCGNPDCDCLDQLWADHAEGATVVPVTVVEIESEGSGH